MAAEPVKINDQEITKLINDPAMRRKFPFLAAAHTRITAGKPKGSCSGCTGKKKGNSAEYENIKRSIGLMSVDQKAALKKELGGRQVVVRYSVNAKKKVTLKF